MELATLVFEPNQGVSAFEVPVPLDGLHGSNSLRYTINILVYPFGNLPNRSFSAQLPESLGNPLASFFGYTRHRYLPPWRLRTNSGFTKYNAKSLYFPKTTTT